MRELLQTQNDAAEIAADEKSEHKGNSSFVPVPSSGTVVPADVADIIAALEEAHGFAAMSPAGRDNIEFAIEKLSALAPCVEVIGITLQTLPSSDAGQHIVVHATAPDGRQVEVIRSWGALPDIEIYHHVTGAGIRAVLTAALGAGKKEGD